MTIDDIQKAQADLHAARPIPEQCYRDDAGRLRSPHRDNPNQQALKELTSGLYDLQKLRIACGNRLCSQLRVRLGQLPGLPADATLSPAVRQLLIDIKESNGKLGTAVANLSSADIEQAAMDLEMQEDSGIDPDAPDALPSTDSVPAKAAKEVAKIQKRLLDLIKQDFDAITDAPKRKPVMPKKKRKNQTEKEFQEVCREAEAKIAAYEAEMAAAELAGKDVLKPARLPTKEKFNGTLIISSYTELMLAASYLELYKQEKTHAKRLESILEDFPVYTQFLSTIKGCGPMMSAVILSSLDPYTAHSPSSFWKYCGLDVVQVTDAHGNSWGEGRSRFSHHLEPRWYTTKAGEQKIRASLTFSPWVKTKLVGVLASSFLKTGLRKEKLKNEEGEVVSSRTLPVTKYGQIYMDYKARLEQHVVYGTHNDGRRDDIRNEYYRVRRLKRVTAQGDEEEDEGKESKGPGFLITSPGRRNRMALRYVIKMFLVDLHMAWRKLEGLPVTLPYHEAKLGYKHLG